MSFAFTKQIALGIAAAAIVVAVFIAGWFVLPHPAADPASMLPAKNTIAVFENVNATSIAPFVHAFPILSDVPLTDASATVAIVKMQTGETLAWAVLTRTSDTNHPFAIRASTDALQTMLGTVTEPLSHSQTYGVLLPDYPAATTWAYVRFSDLPLSKDAAITKILMPSQPTSIAVLADGLSIRFPGSESIAGLPSLTSPPKDIFTHPLFIADIADMGGVILNGSSLVTHEAKLATEATIRTSLASLFGPGLSPRYDIIPLMHGATTLQAAQSGSMLRVVLEGVVTSGNAGDVMNALGDRFKSTLVAVKHESQTFDKKFTLDSVAQDTSLISDTVMNENGWHIRSVRQSLTGKSLFIALSGNAYVISNDEAAFRKTLITPSPSFAATEAEPSGLGLIDSTAFSSLLSSHIPTVWQGLSLPSGTGGYLKWKLSREGQRLTVVIKKV